jgi:hypothetical protein
LMWDTCAVSAHLKLCTWDIYYYFNCVSLDPKKNSLYYCWKKLDSQVRETQSLNETLYRFGLTKINVLKSYWWFLTKENVVAYEIYYFQINCHFQIIGG